MAHSDPPPPFGVQGVLNALSDSCQFLSDSKSLLWPPPCPPTLPKISTSAHDCRLKPPTLSILSRLFAVRKLIKNQTLQNSSQNLKSRTPEQRQPPKCLYIKHFGRFSTFKISPFQIKILSKIDMFSDTSFWMPFFEIWGRLGANKWILGPRRAPS